jgi:hypothetical protein
MKYVFVLLVGLGIGYAWGYGEARDGKPSLATRALQKFGVEKVRDANEKRGSQLEEMK